MQLFLFLLGGKPHGRHIEQHDIACIIAHDRNAALPHIRSYWPDAEHLDSETIITQVDGYRVSIADHPQEADMPQLFFINFGGYRPHDSEEYHKKIVVAARSLEEAKEKAKQDSFYANGYTAPLARSHIDDASSFGIDECIPMTALIQERYHIHLTPYATARFAHNTITPLYLPLPTA